MQTLTSRAEQIIGRQIRVESTSAWTKQNNKQSWTLVAPTLPTKFFAYGRPPRPLGPAHGRPDPSKFASLWFPREVLSVKEFFSFQHVRTEGYSRTKPN